MKNLFKYFPLALLCAPLWAAPPAACAQTPTYRVTNANIAFKIDNAGMAVDGTLAGLAADIRFNAADLASSKIFATIETSTISTKIAKRDEHLRKPDYFFVEQYPKMTLQSTKLEHVSGNSYEGYFKLTIKQVTKDIVIPLTIAENGDVIDVTGAFSINRLDYNVGQSSMILSDTVRIKLVAKAAKVKR